jgi:hypothetical protein
MRSSRRDRTTQSKHCHCFGPVLEPGGGYGVGVGSLDKDEQLLRILEGFILAFTLMVYL